MHRCCTVLLCLFFIINVPTSVVSMELPLVDFKPINSETLINRLAKRGIDFPQQNDKNNAMLQVINITKQVYKNKNDHEIYDIITKQTPYFVAQRLAFHYMAKQGIPDDILSQIAQYMYKGFIKMPLLNSALNGHTSINALTLSADGTMLYVGFADGIIQQWNLATHQAQATFMGHINTIMKLILSKDGTTLYSGSNDGVIKIWNLQTHKHITFPHSMHMISDMTFSPHQNTLYVGAQNGILKACNLTEPFCVSSYPINAHSLALSPDENLLYAAPNCVSPNKYAICIMDLVLKKDLPPLISQDYHINNLVVSKDGKMLYAGYCDRVKVWDLHTQQAGRSISCCQYITKIALSLDGKTLYCCAPNNYAIIAIDIKKRTQIWELREHTHSTKALVVSPDDHTLYAGSDDHTVKIWDLSKNVPILRSNDWRLALYQSFLMDNEIECII